MLSETMTRKKPNYEVVFIPVELHKKLVEHAEQKNITVDKEAAEMLELANKFVEALMAAKNLMKGGDVEL
jgi:hypothetical protein